LSKYKGNIIAALVILCVLAGAFWWGGSAPGLRGWAPFSAATPGSNMSAAPETIPTPASSPEDATGTIVPETPPEQAPEQSPDASRPATAPGSDSDRPLNADEKLALAASLAGGAVSSPGVEKGSAAYSTAQGMVLSDNTGKDKYLTDPVPEGKPVPVEPQQAVIGATAYTCTLSVRCDTILKNIKWLDPEKVELVPDDGVIFPAQKVTFYEGESVFNLLQREMKRNKIHMEFENTPIYNSAYIEGINNLYEFDCGELSGWMYKVNGWFPNYGCSRYALKDGDVIEWVYTCDLGLDVGGYYAVGGE
jgi:hypothetical protein